MGHAKTEAAMAKQVSQQETRDSRIKRIHDATRSVKELLVLGKYRTIALDLKEDIERLKADAPHILFATPWRLVRSQKIAQ